MPCFLALAVPISYPASSSAASPIALDTTKNIMTNIPITTWKQMRDTQVVKQYLDYSCGASSLSTISTHFYNKPTNEE